MPSSSFFSRHSLIALLTLATLIFGSVAIAGTQIQADIDAQYREDRNNPHRIPSSTASKSQEILQEAVVIRGEVKGEAVELVDTIHSLAFRGQHSYSQPILDYTTGTSN
jgi:hypothetical protein